MDPSDDVTKRSLRSQEFNGSFSGEPAPAEPPVAQGELGFSDTSAGPFVFSVDDLFDPMFANDLMYHAASSCGTGDNSGNTSESSSFSSCSSCGGACSGCADCEGGGC
jgi:hypothetical protein